MNDRNPGLDYARSDFDVGQRFVASYVYNLPIGRGKKLLTNAGRGVQAAVSGWSITGIGTFQKGFPFSVLANDKSGLLNTFTQRANVSGDPHGSKSVTKYFNTSAFSQPLAGQFGNSGRNLLRQPGINNFDMGLMKNLQLYERLNLQLRLESFNTFNHVQYGVDPGAPGVGPGSAAIDINVNDQTALGSSSNAFGSITSARPGRILQLGGKITF